jgi:hypothetical protein
MLLNDEIAENMYYDQKPKLDRKKKTHSIKITVEAHKKLKIMKKQFRIKTFDELLFKIIYNSANFKNLSQF